MSLADKNGKFLYEVLPEFMSFGYLTTYEMELWLRYTKWKDDLQGGK